MTFEDFSSSEFGKRSWSESLIRLIRYLRSIQLQVQLGFERKLIGTNQLLVEPSRDSMDFLAGLIPWATKRCFTSQVWCIYNRTLFESQLVLEVSHWYHISQNDPKKSFLNHVFTCHHSKKPRCFTTGTDDWTLGSLESSNGPSNSGDSPRILRVFEMDFMAIQEAGSM